MTNYCQTTYETLPYHSATLLDDQPWMVQTVPCRIQEVRRDPMNRYHSQRGAIPRWLGPAAGLLALTGGKIAVYTGIFPVAKNEAGLAAILGHEVTHALARHGAERMSQGLLAQIGLEAASIALGSGTNPAVGQATMAALGLGVNVGVLLPFSRAHESEADHIGLLLAAQAGYDPHEAIHVWERMEQLSKGQPPEFLSTHPGHGTRIKQLQEWMPEALSYYRPQPGFHAADLPALAPR